MTGKEIILKALRKEPTPRPAWLPFVGVHGAQLIGVPASEYLQSADLLVAGLKKAHDLYRPDGLPITFDLQIEAEILGCGLRWSDESPPSVVSHPLADRELSDLPEYDLSRGRFPVVLNALDALKREWGDSIAFYGLITGPFTLALHLLGNNLFLEMFDRADRVKEVLRFCAEIGKKSADAYLDRGADVIAVVDPMTSQISPKHFEEFVAEYVNEVFDHIRSRGAYSSLFVCGDATRNLENMARTRCDNISIDENISLDKFKIVGEQYHKSIGGNLRLTVVLLLGSEDECRLDAVRCIHTCTAPGFILSPGCDIPWGVPPQNLQAVAEMVHDEYRREIAARTLHGAAADAFEDIALPDYDAEPAVWVDLITLDSTSCAPCQYMLQAAHQAAEFFDHRVRVCERKIKTREGLAFMQKLGVRNIPTLCIDGHPRFISLLPDRHVLVQALQEALNRKKEKV